MMIKHGFSLVECMVYCFLFSLLIMMIFSLAVRTHMQAVKQSNTNTLIVGLYAAQDLFARDIRQSYTSRTLWKKINETELVWHSNDIDVGWQYTKGRVYRAEGVYNINTQSWEKQTKSVVADNIKHAAFDVMFDSSGKHIASVRCTYNDITCATSSKNKRLV